MADRYVVMGQLFVVQGTAVIDVTGRIVADTNFTCAGAGNFTVWMANGTTGTLSGTNVQGTPVTLSAGLNTITTTDAVADGVIDITIGTAANTNDVNSWAASSGGQCGASIPTSADNFYADANSFTAGSQVLTVNATLSCKDMNWTGATNTPTLAISNVGRLVVYGSYTGITAMATSGTIGDLSFYATSGARTITWGVAISFPIILGPLGDSAQSWTMQDALVSSNTVTFRSGTINTGNYSITATTITIIGTDTKVLTPGTSAINCTSWTYSGSNLTVTANTATINCSGNFAGGGITTYHIVNLTGATSTVSGNNTFNTLALPKGTTQTITITDGSTQSAKTFTLSGDAKHTHTIRGTATAGYTLTATGGGTVYMDYVNMSYCTATGATFLYGPHCTMTSCTGWKPAPRYARMMGRRF